MSFCKFLITRGHGDYFVIFPISFVVTVSYDMSVNKIISINGSETVLFIDEDDIFGKHTLTPYFSLFEQLIITNAIQN